MFHVVSKFLNEITTKDERSNRLADGIKIAGVCEKNRADVKHAALLHDIGHLPFSHALESTLESYPQLFSVGSQSINDFTFPVEEHLRGSNLRLSECLTLMILLAPRFRNFYTDCLRNGDQNAVFRVAALAAGTAIQPSNKALPNLISSPIDADKVDYLLRDSRACNVPLGIDVSRLFLRSAFIEVPYRKVPDVMRYGDLPADKPVTEFVVNASGIDTVEEIASSRAALFQRVYTHQTTRNAERILQKSLVLLSEGSNASGQEPLFDALHLFRFGDHELISKLSQNASRQNSKSMRCA